MRARLASKGLNCRLVAGEIQVPKRGHVCTHFSFELVHANDPIDEADVVFRQEVLVLALGVLGEQADRRLAWVYDRVRHHPLSARMALFSTKEKRLHERGRGEQSDGHVLFAPEEALEGHDEENVLLRLNQLRRLLAFCVPIE